MPTKDEILREAHRCVRNARRNAEYAVGKLEKLDCSTNVTDCALATEYAASALKDGAAEVKEAMGGFFRACQG